MASQTSKATSKTSKTTSKTAPGSKKPKKTNTEDGPLVDRALKARWEAAIGRYRRARSEETEGWDERYEALGEILDSDPPYYLAGSYRSAKAFLAAEAPGQDLRSVRRYVRVARHFDPADEVRYGITRLDVLLDYLEATNHAAPLPPAKIDLARQKVRLLESGQSRLRPFAELGVDELRAACRAARRAEAKPSAKLPPIARAVEQALTKAGLRTIAVGVRGGALYLGSIPMAQVPALGAALSKVRIA